MRSLFLLAWLFFFSVTANAAPIIYTLNGIGSGTVDGVAFTDASFSVTTTANTEDSWVFDLATAIGPHDLELTTTVQIEGVGVAQLIGENSVVLFDWDNSGNFSFGQGANALDNTLLSFEAAGLGGWDMLSSLGSLSGTPGHKYPDTEPFSAYDIVNSSLGDIQFSTDLSELTFTAQAVPIPAAVWLFGSALAGLGWLRRKQAG